MRIQDERKCFYQWDLDQTLIVEEECTEVHFSNGTLSKALICEVKEADGIRSVDVPNDLLQSAADIHAYAWNEEKLCVVAHGVFCVEARAKPADYVYTQTEVKGYDALVAELKQRGAYYIPVVDGDGNLKWSPSMEHMPTVASTNVKGPKGEDGQNGVGISDVTINASGFLEISYTDGTGQMIQTRVIGANGKDGEDGASITNAEINTNGELLLTYSNGLGVNLGVVVGTDGYTPVRGIDYWTDADKAEIKGYVDEAILGGAW